jgi:hypothetical protein
MAALFHVIVERLHGHWSAWLAGTPQVGFGGEWPAQAIERLLEAHDIPVDATAVIAVESAARDGHMEFLIPGLVSRIPMPSLN